jgi:hypothetical protein
MISYSFTPLKLKHGALGKMVFGKGKYFGVGHLG